MSVFEGRSIFVVDAPRLVRAIGAAGIARQLSSAHCAGVWIRIGRGNRVQAGLTEAICLDLQRALGASGLSLCGWHVPFCADDAATRDEIASVLQWVQSFHISGLVVDAERTNESPRFQGNEDQARAYTQSINAELIRRGVELAFSSHDQPNLHQDLPFAEFLAPGQPALPQVYNHDADPRPRLGRSETAYRPLLGADFDRRYRPTANASMVGEGAFPSEAVCLQSTDRFLDHVKAKGYLGHSFWCWEEVPNGFWAKLEARPN
jgi:hypothetical protein